MKRLNARTADPASRFSLVLVALVCAPFVLLSLTAASGCGDNPLDEPRRGLEGDTCMKTDDCEVPLRCLASVCTVPVGGGGFDGTLPAGYGPGPGPSASKGPWSQCDECLEGECGALDTACGEDCRSIEACIESTCVHLSETGSTDEGECFTACQNRFPAGKTQHLALVDCAVKQTCSPPCTFYPQDYDLCRTFMNNGDCAGWKKFCEDTPSCVNYRNCISICTTIEACLECSNSTEGATGRAISEAYQKCMAGECLTESWIP